MLKKLSLCDYSDAFKLVKRTIAAVKQETDETPIAADRNERQVIFKNCAPCTDCISEINNTQSDT